MFVSFLFYIFLCHYFSLGSTFNGHVGPSDFKFQFIKKCDAYKSNIGLEVTQRKFNRTTNVLDFNIRSPYKFTEDLILEMKGSLKKEGGFKPGSFYMKDGLCKLLTTLLGETILADILASAGLDTCFFDAGEYIARGFYFDNSKFKVPQIFGEYLMEALIYKNDEVDSCLEAYYELIPKMN